MDGARQFEEQQLQALTVGDEATSDTAVWSRDCFVDAVPALSEPPIGWFLLRQTVALSLLVVACILALLAALRLETGSGTPSTLPEALRSHLSGQSQIHVFLRSSCGSCRSHQQGLESALADFPASIQHSMRSRIHLWEMGKATGSKPQKLLPVTWRSLGIRAAPTTWLVSPQDSIEQIWVGARGSATWRLALQRLQNDNEGHQP